MSFNEFKKVNGISFLKLASGSWRVKVGKKLTGGSIVVKTGSEEFVCKLAREYVEEASRKRDNSIYITDIERMQAIEALNLLKANGVTISLLEVCRAYCERLPSVKGVTVKKACEAYLDAVEERRRRNNAAASYHNHLRSHYDSLTHLYGDQEICDLSAADIEEWLSVKSLNKSSKTHNSYLKSIRAMFGLAVKKKWVVENVSLEVDMLSLSPTVIGVFKPYEIKIQLKPRMNRDTPSES